MSSPVHPRRRPACPHTLDMTPSLIDSFQQMSLRKGSTFHHPTKNDDDLWNPLEREQTDTRTLLARSSTCPNSLEDLLVGAGERRAADLLARVDKAIQTNSKLALAHVLSEPEVLPVPTFMVHHTEAGPDPAALQKARPRLHSHSHSSDSGLGSSVADSVDANAKLPEIDASSVVSETDRPSFFEISAASEQRGLSKYAADQIHEHIVKPILREESLKEFHPLLKDVPHRIGHKDIKTLRDLERTLIFLAPEYSRSPSKYLQFCERTIRVLHATVVTLHESDQRAPTDRPYTQGYFFDLVEQIRRYATILAATREKQEKQEKLDEMDYSPDESVSLVGGMTHNGKPAELVRHKDGKTISIASGQVLSPAEVASSSMKRSMLDVDHEETLRAMARRKKDAKPEIHECPLCDKEFKRPCDLTKHVKTHERPWKCPEVNCKYHEHGWPTEKERDRHVNDKHSMAPELYHCLFKPCPYTSKRESNCKQHMEKAHGWEYVRSKNNGKGRASNVTHLPRASVPPSPANSAMLTPLTPIAPSPSTHSLSSSSSAASVPPPGVPGPSNYYQPSPDFTGHFNMNFNFNDMSTGWPITPAVSDDRRASSASSSYSGLPLDGSAFSVSPPSLTFDGSHDFDFSNFSFHPQQPTPNSAAEAGSANMSAAHASPGAHMDQTFTASTFYDSMNVDEGLGGAPSEDFTLFGGGGSGASASATSGAEMFPPLAEGTGTGTWGTLGATTLSLPAGNTNAAMEELFPELFANPAASSQ